MKDLDHPNIVKLLEVHMRPEEARVDLVFELLDMDLRAYMKLRGAFSSQGLKLALRQCVSAVDFCHVRRIIHRDLKPQNILVHTATKQMKLADFGLSRVVSSPLSRQPSPLTLEVVTVWYRPPELLLGMASYSFAVDIWSLGCIAAEMATGHALFPGDSQIDTLFKIFQLVGTPTETSWPGVSSLSYFRGSFPKWPDTHFNCLHSRAGGILRTAGFDLLGGTLQCDPAKRFSSRMLARHHYFQNTMPEVRAVASSLHGQRSLSLANSSPPAQPVQRFADAFANDLASFLDIQYVA